LRQQQQLLYDYRNLLTTQEETRSFMVTSWAEAAGIAARGFGTVFGVLVILWLATWLMGTISQRVRKEKPDKTAE
jgi:hypothetical protein